jgi:LTXXQ motif family protein
MSRFGNTWLAAGLVLAALAPCRMLAQQAAGGATADTSKPAAAATAPVPTTGVPEYLVSHPRVLNLSPKQVDRIKKVHEWLRGQDSTLRGQWQQVTGGRSLRSMPPADRHRLQPQLQPIMQQLRANSAAALDSVDAILTPQQQQKLQTDLAEYRQRHARAGAPGQHPQQ